MAARLTGSFSRRCKQEKKEPTWFCFPEASVVSKLNYNDPDNYEKAERAQPGFPPDDEEPFEDEARVYYLSGSLRYHRVTAIETKAEEYDDRRIMFMSSLEGKRMGFEPMTSPWR